MFVVKKNDSYLWPVEFSLPGANPGKPDKHSFDAEFKKLPHSEFKKLLERDAVSDADACREVLVGWAGIRDEDGNEIPFSEKAREEILEMPIVATAIAKAFLESYTGAKRKN